MRNNFFLLSLLFGFLLMHRHTLKEGASQLNLLQSLVHKEHLVLLGAFDLREGQVFKGTPHDCWLLFEIAPHALDFTTDSYIDSANFGP
jgi:hypothetical protein